MDDLGLVETVDRFGERIVIAVADAADRGSMPLPPALGVLDRDILAAAVAVMHEAAAMDGPPIMQRLLQRVEHEARMRRPRDAPADDAPGVDVDDEGDVDEAGPGRDIGEVRDPERIRPWRLELPVDVIQRTRRRLVADRRPHRLAADHALQAQARISRSTVQRATIEAFALQLPPDLAHAVDAEVLRRRRAESRSPVRRPAAPAPKLRGSARCAPCAWYVDGAIGNTLQIGSTPYASGDRR